MTDSTCLEEVFSAAMKKSPAERTSFLDSACAGKPDLRARVEKLLAASGASPFDPEAGAPLTIRATEVGLVAGTNTAAGTRIAGRYKLLQPIGEGGMGTVWMAEQTEPVRRRVAVKLIRADKGTSATLLARFEAERQAIALMDHPNVARLLDAGTSEAGQPYFVMELVRGVPLVDYCDTHKLSVLERLGLFVKVCEAVQHAHQKGVIHRDLKPSNILVESHDGKPVPKVIDFGLAKAAGGLQLTEQTLFTQFGSVLGTPAYMAPEQATFNAVDVDTRADVYTLGVILYELLTGTTPLSRETVKQVALDEVLKLIREQDPPTPSTRLSASATGPQVAANRQSEPAKLGRLVKGELDWIVLKALAKDRDRRYETAAGMGRDVERFLKHEPVSAGPPSAAYRVHKFVRRNRPQVLAASVVLVALVSGVVGTSVGLVRAEEKRRDAEHAWAEESRQRAIAQRAATEEAKQRAIAEQAAAAEAKHRALAELAAAEEAKARQREFERAEGERKARDEVALRQKEAEKNLAFAKKGNEILGSVFAALDPKAKYATVADLRNALKDHLNRAVTELEGTAVGDARAVAALQNTLGQSLLGLGEAKEAIDVLGKAYVTRDSILGPDHPDTLTSLNNLATAFREAGDFKKALPLHEKVYKLRTTRLGADHQDTLISLSNLAECHLASGNLERALPLLEESLRRAKARLGPAHAITLAGMNNLALAYKAAKRLDASAELYEEVLKSTRAEFGPDHPNTLMAMNSLAGVYEDAGQFDRALPLHEETLQLMRARLGPEHPDTLTVINNLGAAYWAAGNRDKAVPLFEEAVRLRIARLGPHHPDTVVSMAHLVTAYQTFGRPDLAVPLLEKVWLAQKARLGPDHPDTLKTMANLASTYQRLGQPERAVAIGAECLRRTEAALGPDHPDTLTTMNNLAMGCHALGQFDRAAKLLEQTLRLRTEKLGPDHVYTLATLNNLAGTYLAARQVDRALPLCEDALRRTTARLGANHAETFNSLENLARAYVDSGKPEAAVSLYEERLTRYQTILGPEHPISLACAANLGQACVAAGEGAKAADAFAVYLNGARKRHPKGSVQFAHDLARAAQELLRCDQGAAAEGVLRECLTIREAAEPQAWSTFSTRSMLGEALLGQKKYAEAEPLLLSGFEGMRERKATIPPQGMARLMEAVDRLVDLYVAIGNAGEVKKWQVERAKYPNVAPMPRMKG